MNQIVVGHFEADGALIYLPIGFVPDYFKLVDFHTDTNIIFYEWWRRMEQDQASGKQEGISIAEGVTANLADSGGIVAYDSGSQGPTIATWAADTATTVKSGTAHGDYVRPTTSSNTDRDAVFEAISSAGGDTKTHASTEPTWPAGIGETVVDDDITWERVNVPLKRVGYQGVRIAAALMTDGQEMYYLAIQADDAYDHGDVVSWSGGVYGA